MLAYVHPALGLLAIGLMFWLGLAGLRARHRRPYAPKMRSLHRRYAPWILALVAATGSIGMATVAGLRDDLVLAEGWHFRLGVATMVLMGALWLLSLGLPRHKAAKVLHPAVGLVALAIAAATFAFGIDLLP